MPMLFLRELSRHRDPVCVVNPVEIGWVVALQCRGLVDADIGPPQAHEAAGRHALRAMVWGLTPRGWHALQYSPRPVFAWSEWLQMAMQKLPKFGPARSPVRGIYRS